MSWWTTEQVAEYLGVTEQSIYESTRRKEFPGNLGVWRGKRKMFPSEAIEAGKALVDAGEHPDSPDTTNDPVEAILWTAQGIEAKLAQILAEMRGNRPTFFSPELIEEIMTTGEEEE